MQYIPKGHLSFLKKSILKQTTITSILLLLSACGGSGSDDTIFLSDSTDINVALASNGASTFANYNDTQASKVNDGDTSTSEYWSGNIAGDYVRIDFGKIRKVNEISIYTSDTSFSSSQPNKLIELSIDNQNWSTTAQISGGDIACSSLSLNALKITCSFSNRQQARYLRFTTKATGASAALLNVYEMQAIGY